MTGSTPELLFATGNRGKVAELAELLADTGLVVRCFDDLGGAPVEVVEDRDTFAGNAIKKAEEVARAAGMPALADDSGLEVDALAGAPGVRSARYAGERASDADNNVKLLAALADVPSVRRTARFRSVLAFADPGGRLGDEVLTAEGVCEGMILTAPRGSGGFGYDPLFFVPELGATFAELGVGTKNDRSHRARAMRALRPALCAYFELAKPSGSK